MFKKFISYSLYLCTSFLFAEIDYNTSIQPIFNAKCVDCHGNSAGLNLSSYSNLMAGSNNGDVITPFDSNNSELWIRVNSGQMPIGGGDLTSDESNLVAQWIDEGALASTGGCTDPLAYNCEGSLNGNYVTDIGGIVYDFTCNGSTPAGLESCSENSICEGYYDPDAVEDDGSCRYYQAPNSDQVVFNVQENGININWALFIAPANSSVQSYHVQRCVENCTWLPGFTPADTNTDIETFDQYNYDEGVEIKYAIAVKYTNNPYWGWAIGASYISPASCPSLGDLNGDSGYNVLDIVGLANCVLANNCTDLPNGCAGDMNGDGGYNVLDIVALANCVLANNCGGRVDDATASSLSIADKLVSIEADGFIGGVQMTINHGDDFTIDMTDRALFADYLTTDNQTRLLVINPETEDLFTYDGQFEIVEIMVANTQYEVSVELPLAASFSLSEAYPNPFNPKTAMILSLNQGSNINIGVYNIRGNLISNLASGFIDGGTHSLYWNASEFPSGVYFVKAAVEDEVITQKLILLK